MRTHAHGTPIQDPLAAACATRGVVKAMLEATARRLQGLSPRAGARAPGTHELRENATLRLEPRRRGVTVRARAGSFLVTQEGDPIDHVLEPGDGFRTGRRRRVVAWALSGGALEVDLAA